MNSSVPGPNEPNVRRISLLAIAATLAEGKRILLSAVIGAIVVAGALRLLLPQQFDSRSTFFLDTRDAGQGAGVLAGIAGRITGAAGASSANVGLYSEVASSDQLLGALARDTFTLDGVSTTLSRLLFPDIDDDRERDVTTTQHLRKQLGKSVSRESGLVTLTLRLGDARLSADVLNSIVRRIAAFELNERRARAAERVQFLNAQLAAAADSLRGAEDDLEAFARRNREWQSSPDLAMARERLARAVTLRQQGFVGLVSQLSQASLESASEISAIVPVDTASAALRRSTPRLSVLLPASVALALAVSVFYIFARDAWQYHVRADDPDAQRLRSAIGRSRS